MRTANGPISWTTSTSAAASAYTSSGDISNATLYSMPFWLGHLDTYAIQLVTTGAAVTGAFKLQASNSDPRVPNDGWPAGDQFDWTDIDGSSTTVAAAGTVVWNASNVGYRWVRVVWTEGAASTGNVTGRVNGKGAQ